MKSAIQTYLDKSHREGCGVEQEGECDCGLAAARLEFERLKEIIKAGRTMREHQNNYFNRGRLQGDLKTAKQWESDFDKKLRSLWSAEAPQRRLL